MQCFAFSKSSSPFLSRKRVTYLMMVCGRGSSLFFMEYSKGWIASPLKCAPPIWLDHGSLILVRLISENQIPSDFFTYLCYTFTLDVVTHHEHLLLFHIVEQFHVLLSSFRSTIFKQVIQKYHSVENTERQVVNVIKFIQGQHSVFPSCGVQPQWSVLRTIWRRDTPYREAVGCPFRNTF